jgi:putative sigma-54 modulation protein
MRLQVKGKNAEVSDSIRDYAEQKFQKLTKQLGEEVQVEVELRVEKNPSIRDSQVAEARIYTKGQSLRASAATQDMRRSIDGLTDKLLRELTSYREKRRREPRRRADRNGQ